MPWATVANSLLLLFFFLGINFSCINQTLPEGAVTIVIHNVSYKGYILTQYYTIELHNLCITFHGLSPFTFHTFFLSNKTLNFIWKVQYPLIYGIYVNSSKNMILY